jgi:hypothetical protein
LLLEHCVLRPTSMKRRARGICKLSTRMPAVPQLKRTSLAAAEGGKRKAARKPARRTKRAG